MRISTTLSQKRETLESLRKTVAAVAANPGPACSSVRRALLRLPAGAGALSVSTSVVPGSPGGGWSWCRLAAVSVCCPVLPEAVVGASRATRGRLASTQGCHRCSCRSPWARHWHCARGGCRCSSCQGRQHTGGAPAPATQATVLRNPLQKKKTQEKPAETRCRRCRAAAGAARSEEHTSELQSLRHLVCRLPLEKKHN